MGRTIAMLVLAGGAAAVQLVLAQPALAQSTPFVIEARPEAEEPPPPPRRGWVRNRLSGPRLRGQLDSSQPNARRSAAVALRTRGDAVAAAEALGVAVVRENNAVVRTEIAMSLAFLGQPESVEPLIEAFLDSGRAAPDAIADALATFQTPAALRALVGGLGRADRSRFARQALVRVGPAAVPYLRRLVRTERSVPAIVALGEIGDASALAELMAAVEDPATPQRQAALDALRLIGDDRARNTVRRATADSDANVVNAAWRALAALAGPADADPLAAGIERGLFVEELLPALLRVAPARGVEKLVAFASGDDVRMARLAAEIAMRHPHPGLVPLLHGLVREGSRREEALAALAEAEMGAGLPVLIQLEEAPDVSRALAVAARRWQLPRQVRAAVLSRLRALPVDGPGAARTLMLRSLARDASVESILNARLKSDDAAVRAWAAAGIELLGQADRGALLDALRTEESPEAFRRMVYAAHAVGVVVPAVALRRFEREPRATPAVLRAIGHRAARGERLTSHQRRLLRRSLHDGFEPSVRAAVRAIVDASEVSAAHSLLALYDRSEGPNLRRFVAGAFQELARGRLSLQSEADRRRRAARELAAFWQPGPSGAGRRILRFRVEAEQAPEGILCAITLPSGDIRLQRTLPSGELFVPDLTAGIADVRPILERDF